MPMNSNDSLQWLQNYMLTATDGTWEHQNGISIDTLDNPGWRIKIDISNKFLVNSEKEKFVSDTSDANWIHIWHDSINNQLNIACGIPNLIEALLISQEWLVRR